MTQPLAGEIAPRQRVGGGHAEQAGEQRPRRTTIWKVTISTSSSWNSFQAAAYQRVVKPAGSQVPSQRVAKELTTTVAIIARRLTTKKPTSDPDGRRPELCAERRVADHRSAFPAGGGPR